MRKEGVFLAYTLQAVFSKKFNHKQTFPVHHRLLDRYLPAHSAFLAERGKRHCLYLFQIHALAPLQEIFQTDANALFLGSSAGACGFAVKPKYSLAQPYTTESSMTAQSPSFCLEA